MEKSQKNKRIYWIDAAKGIGVICVIAGHLFKPNTVICRVIFSFHMPLFFFLSGIMFSGKAATFSEYLRKKARGLLLPYLVIGLIGVIITLLASPFIGMPSKEALLTDLYGGNVLGTFYVGQIWFLISLFIISCAFYFVQKRFTEKWQIGIFVFTMVETSIAMQHINDYLPYGRFPMGLETHIMGLAFFGLGYLMKDSFFSVNEKISGGGVKHLYLIVVLLTVVMMLSYFNGWVNIAIPQFNDTFSYIFFASVGITWVSIVSMIFQHSKLLKHAGRNSMIIFGLHSIPLYAYAFLLRITELDIDAGVVSFKYFYAVIGTIFITAIMITIAYAYEKLIFVYKQKKMLKGEK